MSKKQLKYGKSTTHLAQRNFFSRCIVLLAMVILGSACVHTSISRTGRGRLVNGHEGSAKLISNTEGYESIAIISVSADAVSTSERRTRHLLRRASLLGCDAVATVINLATMTKGTCLRALTAAIRSDFNKVVVAPMIAMAPSSQLLATAEHSGAYGQALLRVLQGNRYQSDTQRARGLQWYLNTYPQSPLVAQVSQLLVPAASQVGYAASATPVSVTTAPTSK